MSIRNPVYAPMLAGAIVLPNRLVKISATDQTVIQAVAAGDYPIGISSASITTQVGDRVDVVTSGEYECVAGGTIARGAPVCSDSQGRAVTAAPAAGANNGVVGYAMDSAVVGDLVTVLIANLIMQG